jgi:glyoxylase-like metal-dependent hydrolase (beta-lactamase superfamily II)
MRVAENLEMLDVHMQVMGVQRVIHPTLMWDDENVVIIDTGVPGSLEAIRQQAEAAGAPFGRLNHIVFTQQDIDHISGAAELLAGNPGVTVYAHEKDAVHIRGEIVPKRNRRRSCACSTTPSHRWTESCAMATIFRSVAE